MADPPRPSSTPVDVQTASHELRLYPDPGPFFQELKAQISGASRRVWIETYIYRDDALGAAFARHLAEAAQRGLDVRLLYDPQGSRGSSDGFFDALARSGVQTRAYRPWRLARKRWLYWPRDHGRTVIVDQHAYTGGMNWGREWLPRDEGGDDWHDVILGIQGPTVEDCEKLFLQRWAEASERDDVIDIVGSDAHDVQLVADSAAHSGIILQRLCEAIHAAEQRVWIENSYCVPPQLLLSALAGAVRRGVDVQLLVPGHSDLPSIQAVTRGEYRAWLKSGLCVCEYQPRVMHSKFALIDADWATVGTFNAISPGIWWANETNFIVHDRAFVAALARVFEDDVRQSERITLATVASRPWHLRLWERTLAALYRAVEAVVVALRPW